MLQPPIIWNECKRQTSHFVSVIIQLFTCLCSSCCAWVCLYSTYFFVQGPKITIVSRSDYDLCSYFKCDSLFRNCTDAYRHTRTHTPTAHYHKNKHIYVLIKEDCEKQELMMQATIFIWSEHLSNWHGPCRESEEMKIKRERKMRELWECLVLFSLVSDKIFNFTKTAVASVWYHVVQFIACEKCETWQSNGLRISLRHKSNVCSYSERIMVIYKHEPHQGYFSYSYSIVRIILLSFLPLFLAFATARRW